MTCSLLNTYEFKNGRVSGTWIQDHIGTLESARKAADATQEANGISIRVMAVPQIQSTVPIENYWTDLEVLA